MDIPNHPEDRFQTDIGRQFQEARKSKGLSLQQLAAKADLPLLTVRMWECGPMSMETLGRLLGALKCTLVATPEGIALQSIIVAEWVKDDIYRDLGPYPPGQ